MLKRTKTEGPEWDQNLEPFIKVLLGKKGIKTKNAAEIGRKKVDYFRGRDFKKFLQGSPELLAKKCDKMLKAHCDGNPPETDMDVEKIGTELIQKNFIYKALYKPLNPSAKAEDGSEPKPKKWPDRLARSPNQAFDPDGFYVVAYEGPKGMQHFLLALLISSVLLVVMFPMWPMWAKIGMWYLSVIFLTLYFGILILRMVVYVIFWIVGVDFWILPNINDEYCGFLDSFKPAYSWERRKDDIFMLVVRFGSLIIVAVAVEQISQTTSFSDVQDFVVSSYGDILDWGIDKLNPQLEGSAREMLPSVDELEREDDENVTSNDGGNADDDDDDDEAEIVEVEEPPPKDDL